MSSSDPNKTISLNMTKFPQNLLIPSIDNVISFQAINHMNAETYYRFVFEGENLNITIPEELKKDMILFGASDTKNFEIKLVPIVDGFGKLSINIDWMKIIEYTVKVKKVRDTVSTSKINEILTKNNLALTVSKFVDTFDVDNFFISITPDELNQMERELERKKKEYKAYQQLKLAKIAQKSPTIQAIPEPELTLEEIESKIKYFSEEINNMIKPLAKGYLYNRNPQKALKLATDLSDETEKYNFYYNLIRAYGLIDIDGAVQIIKSLTDKTKKLFLIKNLALNCVKKDLEKATEVALLIEDPSIRENLMIDIIFQIISINPRAAIKFSSLIDNELLRIKILFNIIKELHEKNIKSEIIEAIRHIIYIFEKSPNLDLTENNFTNPAYTFFRDALCLLAELESPQTVDSLIVTTNLEMPKNKATEDLYNLLYVMVDEIRTRVDPNPIFAQYYVFNTYASDINKDVKNFSLIGGNVSNNILTKDFNFNILFVSLFSYNFSIFPIIDRVYTDLKFNLNKHFAYYIYPSKENHNQIELKTIFNTIKQFFLNFLNAPSQLIIFNLDFIPYLGKPTIIFASEPELYEELSSKINNALGNAVNLVFDDSLFKGGTSLENLKQIFPPNCKFVNLLLSYEFFKEYDVFKAFIQSLI